MWQTLFSCFAIIAGAVLLGIGPYVSITCQDVGKDCRITTGVCFVVSIFGTIFFMLGLIGFGINTNAIVTPTRGGGYMVNILERDPYKSVQLD